MIYLVGCDHIKHQTYNPALGRLLSGQSKFRSFLDSSIQRYDIDLVAEELDCEYHARTKRRSLAFDLVQELKSTRRIEHGFCDPTPDKRAKMGISDGPPQVPPWSKHEAMYEYFKREWPIAKSFGSPGLATMSIGGLFSSVVRTIGKL